MFDEQKIKFILQIVLIFAVSVVFFIFFGIIKEAQKIQGIISSISFPEIVSIRSGSKRLQPTSKQAHKKLDVFKPPKEVQKTQKPEQQRKKYLQTPQSGVPVRVNKEQALLL